MLKNKHILTAMIVTPVLAVISYFAIDFLVGETPHAAVEGQSYQLVEKPNCRRISSGKCELKNGDFELSLSPEWLTDERLVLNLESEFALEGVKLALVQNEDDETQPVDMRPIGDDGLLWSLELSQPDPERDRLRLVASSNRSLYFGDTGMKFTAGEAAAVAR